jgi:hypothetical protein
MRLGCIINTRTIMAMFSILAERSESDQYRPDPPIHTPTHSFHRPGDLRIVRRHIGEAAMFEQLDEINTP